MHKISKGEAPDFYIDFLKKHRPNSWNDVSPVKPDLTRHLWETQGRMCAYTELRLPNPDKNSVHIDHYVKQSLNPNLIFSYDNIFVAWRKTDKGADPYGACYKDSNMTEADYNKNTGDYTLLLKPDRDNPEDFLDIDLMTGEYISLDEEKGDKSRGRATIRMFNLNEDSLVRHRYQVMTMVAQNYAPMYADGILSEDVILESVGEFPTAIRKVLTNI